MPSLRLTAITAAQALLLVLSYLDASSVAGHDTTLSCRTSAITSFEASPEKTTFESSIASITVPSSSFATSSRTTAITTTDISGETAAVDANTDLAAPKDRPWREDCLLHHPTCLCDYQAQRTWYKENCQTFIFFKIKCWSKPELARFCGKGEEKGPPAIRPSPAPPTAKPKPEDQKKHENCWIDGILPDDCEAPEKHRGGPA